MSRDCQTRAAEVHLWSPGVSLFGGGIGTFNQELAMALAVEWPLRVIGKEDQSGTWKGLPLHGSGHAGPRLKTLHFAASLATLAVRHRPSLIVSGHVNFSPVAMLLRRPLGAPYVVVAYGVEIDSRLGVARLAALRAADSVWSISRWTTERLRAVGVSESKILQVPVPIAQDRFHAVGSSANLRARLGIPAHEKIVLTVARLDSRERYKGCDLVMAALPDVCEAVGSVRHLVVGSGDDLVRLKALAETLDLGRRVTFCGFVPDEDLPHYYRLADAFALPSTGEGFGIVFLEAMASGVPVLAGNGDGSREALMDGKLGLLVDPSSPRAVAEGIVQLLRRQGPKDWFDPEQLRHRCIEAFGRETFARDVGAAVQALTTPASTLR